MPRSRGSQNRARGGRRGGGKAGLISRPSKSIPVISQQEMVEEPGSLRAMALNTQRRHPCNNFDYKLRHARINFVSAGGFEPSELIEPILAQSSLHTAFKSEIGENAAPTMMEDTSQIDTLSVTIVQGPEIAHPEVRSPSPTRSDSSEEVILFGGRDKSGRGIRKIDLHHRYGAKSLTESEDNVAEGNSHSTDKTLLEISTPRETGFGVHADDAVAESLDHSHGGWHGSSKEVGVETKLRHRSMLAPTHEKLSRELLLDDYIANIDPEYADQITSYNKRNLGDTDSELWQDAGLFEKSTNSKLRHVQDVQGLKRSLTRYKEAGVKPIFYAQQLSREMNPEKPRGSENLNAENGNQYRVDETRSIELSASGFHYFANEDSHILGSMHRLAMDINVDPTTFKSVESFNATKIALTQALVDEQSSDSDSGSGSDSEFEATEAHVEVGQRSEHDERHDDPIGADEGPFFNDMQFEHSESNDLVDQNLAALLSRQELGSLGTANTKLPKTSAPDDQQDNGDDFFSFRPIPSRSSTKALRSFKHSKEGFPAAGQLANAYDGFDVMDFDRPSLKRKAKGRKGKPAFDLSDSELEKSLTHMWDNDRLKKQERREQRQELRSLGLLGVANQKMMPDLKAKYQEGMSLHAIRDEIRKFLQGDETTLAFPAMNKSDRKLVHEIANAFKLKSKSAGQGSKRFPVIYRTARAYTYSDSTFDTLETKTTRRFLPRMDVKGKGSGKQSARGLGGFDRAAVGYKDGDIVGGSAPELGAENKGRAMLEKMGWSSGTALGALNNKGILQPVSHIVKTSKAGLG